jgi:hypothetical protein
VGDTVSPDRQGSAGVGKVVGMRYSTSMVNDCGDRNRLSIYDVKNNECTCESN